MKFSVLSHHTSLPAVTVLAESELRSKGCCRCEQKYGVLEYRGMHREGAPMHLDYAAKRLALFQFFSR